MPKIKKSYYIGKTISDLNKNTETLGERLDAFDSQLIKIAKYV